MVSGSWKEKQENPGMAENADGMGLWGFAHARYRKKEREKLSVRHDYTVHHYLSILTTTAGWAVQSSQSIRTSKKDTMFSHSVCASFICLR